METTRRQFLATASAAFALSGPPGASADWTPSSRYPDPAIKVLDPAFAKYRLNAAKVERLATGFRWCEGPVWFGDGRYLLWSDIPNNQILKWEEETGRDQRVPQALAATPTATRGTARDGWSPASTKHGVSRAPNTTEKSR